MKRLLFGVATAITLLAPSAAKSRVITIAPPHKDTPIQIAAKPSPQQVDNYVVAQCKIAGIQPADCSWIVSHESQDGDNMRGDDGQSRGYWMISSVWHPEVTNACADDLSCSTAWAIREILHENVGEGKNGGIDEWSTWRWRFKWFGNEQPPL
jgi:hypothetical protein